MPINLANFRFSELNKIGTDSMTDTSRNAQNFECSKLCDIYSIGAIGLYLHGERPRRVNVEADFERNGDFIPHDAPADNTTVKFLTRMANVEPGNRPTLNAAILKFK